MLPQPMTETFAVWPAKAATDVSGGSYHCSFPTVFAIDDKTVWIWVWYLGMVRLRLW